MRRQVILDTGPLVAFLNRQDTYHDWSVKQWGEILPPMLTCEAVLSEACFLLRRQDKGIKHILELLCEKGDVLRFLSFVRHVQRWGQVKY